MNQCPNCAKIKPTEMYACKPCWFSLPKHIRDDIWKGYRGDAKLWNEADKRAKMFWDNNHRPAEVSS